MVCWKGCHLSAAPGSQTCVTLWIRCISQGYTSSDECQIHYGTCLPTLVRNKHNLMLGKGRPSLRLTYKESCTALKMKMFFFFSATSELQLMMHLGMKVSCHARQHTNQTPATSCSSGNILQYFFQDQMLYYSGDSCITCYNDDCPKDFQSSGWREKLSWWVLK